MASATPEEGESEAEEGAGSKVRLKAWSQRKRNSVGYDAEDRPVPLIDQLQSWDIRRGGES